MEKRVIVAIALSFAILLLWAKLFPPPRPQEEVPQADHSQAAMEEIPVSEPSPDGEVKSEENRFPEETTEREETKTSTVSGRHGESVSLGNQKIRFNISGDGASIRAIEILEHVTDSGDPVSLLFGDPFRLSVSKNKELTHRLRSAPYLIEKDAQSVTLTYGDGNILVRKTYTLKDYFIYLDLDVQGIDPSLWALELGPDFRMLDKSEEKSRFAQIVNFVYFTGSKLERASPKKAKKGMVLSGAGIDYFGMSDRYFAAVVLPEETVGDIRLSQPQDTPDQMIISFTPGSSTFKAKIFTGGMEYDTLKQLDPRLTYLVKLGFFGFIARPMLWALQLFHKYIHNWGVAIILLTLILRFMLMPLTRKQLKSMKGMQKLQPQVERLKTKYKKHKSDPDERTKMNQEIMELYRQEGVNPMGGCLPLLIQIPILWAFYNLLSAAIELRHAPFFLWIQDLSAPDPYYITPILMGAAMLAQQLLTPSAGTAAQKKTFLLMPIIFTFIGLGFPSGLILYWMTNNLFQIVEMSVYRHLEKKEALS